MKAAKLLFFVVALTPAAAFACGDNERASGYEPTTTDQSVGWQKITIKELNQARGNATIAVFDANSAKTRMQYGVIPGATLLSSATAYDTGRELPADKNARLVFYCANKLCTASHSAAERAVTAGYKSVYILPDGIMGWKEAGQPTVVPTS